MSEFGWIIGNSPGHAGLSCQDRKHAVLLGLELSLTGSRGSEGRISGYVLKVIRNPLARLRSSLLSALGSALRPSKAGKVAAVR